MSREPGLIIRDRLSVQKQQDGNKSYIESAALTGTPKQLLDLRKQAHALLDCEIDLLVELGAALKGKTE